MRRTRSREQSAWRLGFFKQKWLLGSVTALSVPIAFIPVVAVALAL